MVTNSLVVSLLNRVRVKHTKQSEVNLDRNLSLNLDQLPEHAKSVRVSSALETQLRG